jgi:hypothetical protein
MKIIKTSFLLTILVILVACDTLLTKKAKKNFKSKSHSKSKNTIKAKDTPKGADIRNHYGTPNIANQYGPQDDAIAQYVQANPDTFAPMLGSQNRNRLLHANDFKPYPGYEQKMNPSPVKSGEYTNIAPSAKNEVNPEITGPKLEVNAQIEYPTAVKVPTFYGFTKEIHPVIAYDKLTGEIIEDNVVIQRPVYNYENRVSNVSRNVQQHYDLRNGEKITVKPNLKKFGIDQVSEDWKAPEVKKKCDKKRRR